MTIINNWYISACTSEVPPQMFFDEGTFYVPVDPKWEESDNLYHYAEYRLTLPINYEIPAAVSDMLARKLNMSNEWYKSQEDKIKESIKILNGGFINDKTNLEESVQTARAAMIASRDFVPDIVALQNEVLYDMWLVDTDYIGNNTATTDNPANIVKDENGDLYRCLISHKSLESWTPKDSSSLWVKITDPTIEYPEWIQPITSEDSYNEGDKVSHNGKKYISKINGNTTEPGFDERWWEEVVE